MRVRLLREAGGLGDVLRTLGVARALKERWPDCHVGYYVLSGFHRVAEICPDVDRVYRVRLGERRDRDEVPDPARREYLRSGGSWDATVDLYCPAWRHEADCFPRVTQERIESFARAASRAVGTDLPVRLPWIPLDARTQGRAAGWLEGKGLDPDRPVVVLQTHAAQAERRWPAESWVAAMSLVRASVPSAQFLEVSVVRRSGVADALRAKTACLLPTELLLGVIRAASLVVGPDSGLLHVAGMYGVPSVGIYGVTTGENVARYYPRQARVEATPDDRAPHYCGAQRERFLGGPCWNVAKPRECRNVGCHAMNAVAPERVAAACVAQLLSG